MKEINIARAIIHRRKERGITQEELASHIGVSSASVSKWETSQSYPDVVLLPQLAAYFNISIDELMGYEPQMSTKEIGKLFAKLYGELSTKPLEEVIESCRGTIKKYFSCFPLLLQMGDILVISSGFIEDKEKSSALIAEAKELFVQVKRESDDAELQKNALYLEAMCAMILGNPDEVIELLGKPATNISPHELLLSSAYQMTGRKTEAETVLQVAIFQNLVSTLSLLNAYAMLGVDKIDRLDEIVKRTLSLVESFNFRVFQPSTIISCYVVAAQGYLAHQSTDRALDLLEQYAELAAGDIALQIKGDGFFNLIDDWLNEAGLESPIPPHESIKQGLADNVIHNPVFSVLQDNPRFQSIAKRLEGIC